MSQRKRTIWAGSGLVACAAIGLLMLPALLQGDSSPRSAPSKFVVHEWGTFTSFSGSDGVNLEYRPLVTNDLPRFVMTPYRQLGNSNSKIELIAKDRFYARQRMETPVTYFYTDVPRTVNVRVDFPTGLLTEWYPVVKNTRPEPTKEAPSIKGYSNLDWGTVNLIPTSQFADVRVRGPKNQPVPATLPTVKEGDHYGRARETDSAIVETVDVKGGSHFEKFLFYRGVGNFQLPLKLAALGNNRFEVANAGDVASGTLLLVRIEQGWVRFAQHAAVQPNASVEISLPDEASSVDELAAAMVKALTAAGLYEKESFSMVNTWRNSWFGEDGTRLLYLLPGKWTDELLPLQIDPMPDEQIRVMVGRLETLTPEDCERLTRKLAGRSGKAPPASKSVEAELKSLGRFAEPAIKFAVSQTKDASTRERLETVLASVRGNKN